MKIQRPTLADIKKHRFSIAAVIITCLALFVVDLLWIEDVVSRKQSLEEKVKQQEELIRKYKQKLQQTQSIRENVAKHESELKEMQKKLFRGTDPYQLAASLSDLLKGGNGQKLDIKTYQVLASKEYGLYQEVHLRFNLMTNVDGLYYFLSRVKNTEFAVLVHEINIQKIQRAKGPDLVVNVILAALMEKGEKT
ncbi:MAG: type 4a pilus biogenesis protein PilO [Desulfobacteraceae bacterium]|nr:type 4a pilus biogenesis protein PilO [Desulfobacteraceae bacterium]